MYPTLLDTMTTRADARFRTAEQIGIAGVLTKSGLMLGLGETDDEVIDVMRDLRDHGVDMLTIGQYLQPRPGNLPVHRYAAPAQFDALRAQALAMGFANAACGPLVRSSYQADRQALAAGL